MRRSRIEGILHKWKPPSPIGLLLVTEDPEISFHSLISPFRLSISLRVVSDTDVLLDSQFGTDILSQFGSKFRISIRDVTPQGLSYVPRVYLYLYSAIYVLRLAYVYHRTALPLIPDIPAISILSCFRFTDVSWLTCLFGPHFSRSRCPFDSYLPPLLLARVSHFCSYDSDLFCSLLSTILRISQPISGFLTRLLGSL